MKIYDLVKEILTENVPSRSNDKLLLWLVWDKQKLIKNASISMLDFITYAEHFETIRRTRQKIQELYPSLRANALTQARRSKREKEQGTFIFRDKTPIFDNVTNTVRFV